MNEVERPVDSPAPVTGRSDVHRCPVCGGNHCPRAYRLRSGYLDRTEEYDIHLCADCGHGFAEGRCDSAYLEQIYGGDFHASSQQAAESEQSPVVVNARQRVQWLADTLGLRGRLLDIGAGAGAFVAMASDRFDAFGLELSEAAVKEAEKRGINVIQGDVMSGETNLGRFDVITLWDVIASIQDGRGLIRRCATLMEPEGVLVLTVPMVDSMARRLSGRYWPLWIPPVNLNWFSGRSIRLLLEQEGFRVEECRLRGKRVSLRFVVQKALRSLGLYRFEQRCSGMVPDLKMYLNTFDICTVVARRRSSGD